MELRQLEYFVEVADEASFTRAAAKLHVAQPGISAQIRRMEAELGQVLFDRSGRAVTLTAAGRTVMPYARAALAAVAGIGQAVDDLVGLVRGRIAVGMIASCAVYDMAELLASFHHLHPAVEIHLSEAASDDLVAQVRDGRLDVALVGLGVAEPGGLDVLRLADEPLVAAVRSDHELVEVARLSSLPLATLGDHPLISLPRGTGLRAVIDAGCASVGFRPQITFEASDPYVLGQLAARGLGVALIPASVAARNPALVSMLLTDPTMNGRVALAWRADGSSGPAAAALVTHARNAAQAPRSYSP